MAIGGVVAGVGEFSNVFEGSWRGLNGKWNSELWNGNRYTGSKQLAIEKAEKFNKIAKKGFYIDTLFAIPIAWNDLKSQNMKGVAKVAIDEAFGAVGTYGGPVGLGLYAGYTAIDLTIGWDQAIADFEKSDKATREVTGRGIWYVSKI